MPEIEHHDLVLFADQKVNLKKDEVDDQRAQVNRLRDRIEAKIAVTPGYGLVKSLHAGSVAKGTALSSVNDRDLAVYVRAEQAPNDVPSLVYWLRDRVVEAYSTLSADQIVANSNCVTVTFAGSGLSVDVVPVLYQGEPNDVGHLVNKDTGEKLLTSVRQHLDFIRGRKKQHQCTSRSSSGSPSGGCASSASGTPNSDARASWSSCCGSTLPTATCRSTTT